MEVGAVTILEKPGGFNRRESREKFYKSPG
jgi:hypothetical protein